MIRVNVVRVEEDGSETDLGDVRLLELRGPVVSYRETADGAGVMRDVRRALEAGAGTKPSTGGRVSWPPSRGGRVFS